MAIKLIVLTVTIMFNIMGRTLCLAEGELCLGRYGKGICLDALKCESLENSVVQNTVTVLCGFEESKPIVCCVLPEAALANITAKDKTPTESKKRNKNMPIVLLQFEEWNLSRKKCLQFYPDIWQLLVPEDGGGAIPARNLEFKHMAAVGFGKMDDIQWLCGGSLISHNFVLTAAHCLVSPQLGNASFIRLGTIDISNENNPSHFLDIAVQNIYRHAEYNLPERYHDIGLIELQEQVQFSYNIKPACLDFSSIQPQDNLIVTGWGRTSFTGDPSTTLLKVDIEPAPFAECKKYFPTVNDELQLCAGGGLKIDTCKGDSGGPLQRRDTSQPIWRSVYHIIAITSFGQACGLTKSPGVYTRVYPHLKWIERTVWPKEVY